MKLKLPFFCFLLFISFTVSAQEDYLIEINGKVMPIALDRNYETSVGGKAVTFKVFSKDTLTYNDDLFSFKYSKDFKTSKVDLEDGISQVMVMTAEGSGFIIQKYDGINPEMLNELMLNEVVKESVDYGYEMRREDYVTKLKSGREIKVGKAVLTYKGDTSIYEVASIGSRDEGILILTMIATEEYSKTSKELIDTMWKTLTYMGE
ncbi:hypothetical protein E0W68_10655 [Flavobacterium salilacus subsp. salilacus]|uniref:hypothetical protein n=1 Tax=Flavobacterium TaxID=237 RepID=UPI001074C8D2|nr:MULTISPECIES: hypothetical protein [Flavobacterium]KAF2518187.1 hypothetical protein E0W68_10655 [Flavobacterium salilacus subsp. salilacus]MBE1615500.1 hypothetical protein [Flavobacterium sp. SaA2.13]